MIRERGLDVEHSALFRWVHRFAPQINKRIPPHALSKRRLRISSLYPSALENNFRNTAPPPFNLRRGALNPAKDDDVVYSLPRAHALSPPPGRGRRVGICNTI
jgi:hypothetical protein